ncbi:hypothetical protein YN1HA_3470 [Sulfurisphaera ohwakuensis]
MGPISQPKFIPALNLEKDNIGSFTEVLLRLPVAVEDDVTYKELKNA